MPTVLKTIDKLDIPISNLKRSNREEKTVSASEGLKEVIVKQCHHILLPFGYYGASDLCETRYKRYMICLLQFLVVNNPKQTRYLNLMHKVRKMMFE